MHKTSKFLYNLTIFLIFSAGNAIFSQSRAVERDFATEEPNWSLTLNGKIIAPPQATSYGFAVLTDGRTVYAASDDGTVLWQRQLGGRISPYLTVLDGDFLLTVFRGNTLTLLNPEGLPLWSVRVPFTLAASPFIGRDARIFVRGKTDIACYGIKGVCKWHIRTEEQDTQAIQELPDGSVVVLLVKPDNGKTTALRISPFGEIIEKFAFTGIVASCVSSSQGGILVTLKSGGAGLCAIDGKNKTSTKWALSRTKGSLPLPANDGSFFIPYSSTRAALVQPAGGDAAVTFYTLSDGEAATHYRVSGIDVSRISYIKPFLRGMAFADANSAVFCTERESAVWNVHLPDMNGSSDPWNYLLYTESGYLIMCKKSWTIAGFRVVQNVGGGQLQRQERGNYNAFFTTETPLYDMYEIEGKLDTGLTGTERRSALDSGMYGPLEKAWASELKSACEAYRSARTSAQTTTRTKRSVFIEDVAGTDAMFKQLSRYGTSTESEIIARLIEAEGVGVHLPTLIAQAGECAYDPAGSMLDSLDKAFRAIPSQNTRLLQTLCDTVFSICRFMGRPAFYRHGKDILARLLYPQYDPKVRAYAGQTLQKIAALGKDQAEKSK
ncbi:PQQ-like domain protein [Treponema socranskii subsp. socranskii VPI DR56BR1116 = ATCC 35536]|uniref:PQQ-like domain protein n=2 Tax=Treponema socranskii subsp. socranskii VPI DR56BR1116 = ATCC 35536 TaxID=1125725 RepID=A0ABN0P4Z1_TRESO|nr:PQQ-binding-like beta-propeller repeat protein [Treponema socranskii]ERK01309.1 PQQ-like domain protein [Treponema socranskii subsp. socranskii VPI DR56BR1116 = ATCC 35536]